jgi:hypothetical protein
MLHPSIVILAFVRKRFFCDQQTIMRWSYFWGKREKNWQSKKRPKMSSSQQQKTSLAAFMQQPLLLQGDSSSMQNVEYEDYFLQTFVFKVFASPG